MDFFFQQFGLLTLDLPRLNFFFPHELQMTLIFLRISSPVNICGGGLNSCSPSNAFFCFLNGWLHGRNRLCPVYGFFFPCFNLQEYVSSLHIGQPKYPLTVHPDKFPYAGKSLIVYNRTTLNEKNSH